MAIRKKRLFLQHTTSSEKWNSQNSRLSYACAARTQLTEKWNTHRSRLGYAPPAGW